jgi:SAM-dependent methyltransferase
LAYRDLPAIINANAKGRLALDFGCGTGRSSRFLTKLGFDVCGIDISEEMILAAQSFDQKGEYLLIEPTNFSSLNKRSFDLVLAVFTFDNIPDEDQKLKNLQAIKNVMKEDACLIMLVSTPDIYVNEWASFSTRNFPGNWKAKSGDRVQIIMTDVDDNRPVDDIMCSDESYRKLFKKVGFTVSGIHQPLGADNEGIEWLNERRIAPWSIYILQKKKDLTHMRYMFMNRW